MKTTKNIYYWLRLVNDMSQEEVAEQLQISLSYVRAIENEKKIPSKRLRRAYANLFEINEEIIVEFSNEKTTTLKKFLLLLLQKIAT